MMNELNIAILGSYSMDIHQILIQKRFKECTKEEMREVNLFKKGMGRELDGSMLLF